jgi:hypothetical protein
MATKRTRIDSGRGGSRFVRRDSQGQFKEVDAVGRSLKQDRARKARNTTTSGQGDKGDRKISGARAGKGRSSSGGRKGASRQSSRARR